MLHILWILIKFILILLGILLGLVLLAVLLVLFCPVRYSAAAAKEGDSFKEAEIEARVSWLFRAIGVRFFFKNGEQKLVITLFGISLDQIRGWLDGLGKRRKARRRRRRRGQEQRSSGKTGSERGKTVIDSRNAAADDRKNSNKPKEQTSSEQEKLPEKKAEVKEIQVKESELPHEKTTEPESEKTEEGSELESKRKEEQPEPICQESAREIPEKISPDVIRTTVSETRTPEVVGIEENKGKVQETSNSEDTASKTAVETVEQENSESVSTAPGKGRLPVLFTRIRDILTRIIGLPGALWRKITSFIKGILGKIRHIRNTIAGIRSKLDWWKEFLGNEKTKAAIALVWKDAKGLIHHVLPTKVEGQITFGCDDPSITGTVLAVLGMTFPFHQNRIQVTPLFDGENQLTGNISLKGRIYGIMFVKAALEIYINKNVKYVINRWKHKED